MRFRAVFFDFDDTLHDFQGAFRAALVDGFALAGARYPAVPVAAMVEGCYKVWPELWQRYLRKELNEQQLRLERTASAMRWAGIARPDPALVTAVDQRYLIAMEAELRPFPDALPVLAALHGQVSLGVLTNGPAHSQRSRLTRLGMAGYFNVTVISGEVGVAKPDPAFFRLALAQAGIGPEAALMAGDHPEADVAGAKAAGMAAAWLNRHGADWPSHLARPDVVVTDLLSLLPWLRDGADRP